MVGTFESILLYYSDIVSHFQVFGNCGGHAIIYKLALRQKIRRNYTMLLKNLFHKEKEEKAASACGTACGTGDKK